MSNFRRDIEGLRAVAVLLVVAAHYQVPGLAGGFVGVDVFFVLSGYLITGLLLAEISDDGRIDLIGFYTRRLRRLLPALLLMLLVTAGLSFLVLPASRQLGNAEAVSNAAVWLSNLYFAFTDFDYFSNGAEQNLYLHTWSLGVEEQFYLVWPLLLVGGIATQLRSRRRTVIVMMVVFLASFGLCWYWTTQYPRLGFYLMPARAWQFALGALTVVLVQKPRPWLAWVGIASILASALMLDGEQAYPGVWAVLPSLGAAAVLAAGSSRVLELSGLQRVGRISYSWYLWHWPVLLLGVSLFNSSAPLIRVQLLLLSLVIATAAYFYVEAPLRRSPKLIGRQALVGALVAMVGSATLAAEWKERALESDTHAGMYARVKNDYPTIYWNHCDDGYKSSEVRPCTSGPPAARTAVAIGDSIGMQWYPALAGLFRGPEWQLVALTKSSCPIVNAPFFYKKIWREFTECSIWRDAAIAKAAAMRPEIVVMGSTDSYGLSERQWIEGTIDVLRRLSANAGRVVIIRATPSMPFDGPECLYDVGWLKAKLSLDGNCRTYVDDRRGREVLRWLRQAASKFNNVSVVDMNDQVCPGGVCSAIAGDIPAFRDRQHLTATFVKSLIPALGDRIGMP